LKLNIHQYLLIGKKRKGKEIKNLIKKKKNDWIFQVPTQAPCSSYLYPALQPQRYEPWVFVQTVLSPQGELGLHSSISII